MKRLNEPGCRAILNFAFDPDELGVKRSRQVWEGVARIVKALLEPEEVDEFMRQFARAAKAGRPKGADHA